MPSNPAIRHLSAAQPRSRSGRRARLVRLLLAVVLGLAVVPIVAPAAPTALAAVGDCGFTGAVATFTATSGSWSTASNWDTNSVPTGGQICVPAGRTAVVGNGVNLGGQLRVRGTLNVNGTGVVADTSSVIDNTGTINVAAGASWTVYFGPGATIVTFINGTGGQVNVAGRVTLYGSWDNAGGDLDVTGAGRFEITGTFAQFRQGADSAPTPRQSRVLGNGIHHMGGKLVLAGSGAGVFTIESGATTLSGTIRSGQTVNVVCGVANDTYAYFSGPMRNEGTFSVLARAAGTTCTNWLYWLNGGSLANAGTITAAANSTSYFNGAGTITNEATGTVAISGTFGIIVSTWINDGTVTVAAGATLPIGDGVFEARSGLLDNQGVVTLNRSSPTYAFYAIFRQRAGIMQGNPIRLDAGNVDLIGQGAVSFIVPYNGAGNLRNSVGPIVIGADQSITLNGGMTVEGSEIENRGLITVDGSGTYAVLGSSNPATRTVNRGRILLPTGTGGGTSAIGGNIVNEPGGVIEMQNSTNTCAVGGITNRGLIDVSTVCITSGVVKLEASSVLRVRSSAAALSALADLRIGSTVGGTLEIITDPVSPPSAGSPRNLLYPRNFHYIVGRFATVVGSSLGNSLAYSVIYPPGYGNVQLQVAPAVAINVSAVSAPSTATVGDDATVTWTTQVGGATTATWTESVLLSNTPVPDASAIVLARVTRSGSIPAGTNLSGSAQVRIPSTTPGTRYLVVVADSGSALAVPDRTTARAAKAMDIDATMLTVGAGGSSVTVGAIGQRVVSATSATLGGTRLLRISGAAGSDLRVTVSPTNSVVATAAIGRAPTDGDVDATAVGGVLVIPRGDGVSARYVLLRNTSSTATTVTVTATNPGASIAGVSPPSVVAGSPAQTAVTVTGTNFTAASVARLVCGSTIVNATTTQVAGSTSLTSLFPLPTALGQCTVEVGAASLPNALNVTAPALALDAAGLKVDVQIVAPETVRGDSDNRLTVRWTNRTGYSLPAPLFSVNTTSGGLRFAGEQGLGSPTLFVLGISSDGPAGILAPGASGSAELILRSGGARASYSVAMANPNASYDLATAIVAGFGNRVPQAAKQWLRTNGPAIVGLPATTTVGAYQQHLGDLATRLSALGRRIPNPARLLAYDLSQLTDHGQLDGFLSGEYGVGQVGLGIPRLQIEATGDVLFTDGTEAFRFARQANGKFVAPPGIADQLVPAVSGGGYDMVARDGTRRMFSAAGLLTAVLDANLISTTFGYTSGRLTSITDPAIGTKTFTYDGAGRITSATDPVGRVTTYGYDANGRQTTVTERGLTYATGYDANNLPISLTAPGGLTVTSTRDAFGRITETRTNGTLTSTNAFQSDGSVITTDALGRSEQRWPDDTGTVAKTVDAAGRITTVRRDAAGSPIGLAADGSAIGSTIVGDGSGRIVGGRDGAGGLTRIGFDFDGLLESVTDPDGRSIRYTRDDARRPVAIADPLGATTRIAYDSAGRTASMVDRSGRSMQFSYDGKDRLDSIVAAGSGGGGGTTSMTYDARGNMLTATGAAGTTTMGYDSADRLVSVSYPTGLGLTFTFDAAGRRDSMTTSDGQVTRWTYDSRGRLATVATGATIVTRYEYDAIDRLTAIALANGQRTEISYDLLGRVTRQRTTCCTANGVSAGGTTIADAQTTYDLLDRIATRTDAAGVTTYSYDGASRLVGAVTTGAAPRSIQYSYDGAGNRTQVVDNVGGNRTSTLDGAGRPTQIGAAAVTHDADGRVTGKGADSYTWNARGRLVTSVVAGVTTTYTYDALGTPLTRTTAGVTTRLLIDPSGIGSLVAEYSAANSRLGGYAWGHGIAASLDASGAAARFYASDAHGDVLALTNAAGTVTDTYRYLPFGEVAARTGSSSQPFQYQGVNGLRTDPNGLIDMRARMYDPTTGRFISEDPLLSGSSSPAAFADNDPVNRVDRDGNQASSTLGGIVDTGLWGLGIPTDLSHPENIFGAVVSDGATAADLRNAYNAMKNAPINAKLVKLAKDGKLFEQLAKTATNDGAKYYLTEMAKENKKVGQALLKTRRPIGPGNRLGGAFDVAQGAKAVYDTWNDPKLDSTERTADITRHVLTTGLKLYFGRIPGAGFAIDRAVDFTDAGSQYAFDKGAAWWYGVDPKDMYKDETGWKPGQGVPEPKGGSDIQRSGDPNSIVGPTGVTVGSNRFVARGDVLPYRVNFENKVSATLPATEVIVAHTLDSDIDMDTFALGAVGFAGRSWDAPAGVRSWSTLLDDRDVSGLFVRMQARLDRATRTVTWTFTAIDPVTMDRPADATRGFLPRNVTSPQGEGFTSYTAKAVQTAPTGTAIVAQASIIFDVNEPIATNVDTVVIDAAPPSAAPNVGTTSPNPVPVTLGATDDTGGSGVGVVDVWASRDGGVYTLVGDGVTGTTFWFTGVVGSSYRFVVTPKDAVGNRGATSTATAAVEVAPGATPPPSASFTPLQPARLLETRSGPGAATIDGQMLAIGTRNTGTTTELQITGRGGVPTNATAAVLNITVTEPQGPGFITIWPCGTDRPNASNLNYTTGTTIPNAVITKLTTTGTICIYTSTTTHLIADVNGYFPTG